MHATVLHARHQSLSVSVLRLSRAATRRRSQFAAWFAAALKGLEQVRGAERSYRTLRSARVLPT